MDHQELVSGLEKKIEKIIDDNELIDTNGYPFDNNTIRCVSKYSCDLSGQLLRPRILLGAAKSYCADHDVALTCAAVVEIVHADTLALDDIMDRAKKRRNKLTTYMKHGLDRTMLSCYNLNPQINEAVFSLPLSMRLRREISKEINLTNMLLVRGQEYDTSQSGRAKTLDDFAKIFELKTGSLMGAAAAIGARIGNANKEEVMHLRNFGVYLGIAYQFFDDWKDKYCSECEVGKSIGLDKRKKTPFDIAKTELVIAEYLKYQQKALVELSKIRGRDFDDLIKISIRMFSIGQPKAL